MRIGLLLLGACGFSAHAAPDAAFPFLHDSPADTSLGGPDAMVVADAAPLPEPFILACSSGTLYKIDVDQQTTTVLGPIKAGGTSFSMDAIAGNSNVLYGIPTSVDKLIQIDPASGVVTLSRTLAPSHNYYGLAYAPAGEVAAEGVWFAGTDGGGETAGLAQLYTIDPASGTATAVGPFGGGLEVAGDLAWVHGHGLYGTFYGPTCMQTTCIASVNTTTGTATVLSSSGPINALSLSGFRGQLWALQNNGAVWSVDATTGNATLAFTTGIAWADAAN